MCSAWPTREEEMHVRPQRFGSSDSYRQVESNTQCVLLFRTYGMMAEVYSSVY